MDILTAKAMPIEEVAIRLGLEVQRHKTRCISRTHRDNTPSLSFHAATNRFKCFACDLQGDVIDLIQIVMGSPFKEAVSWLQGDTVLPELMPAAARTNLHVPRLGNIARLTAFWEVCDPSGDWLASKGLSAGQFGVRKVTVAAHNLIPEFPVGGLFIPYYQGGKITWGRWRNTKVGDGARFLSLPGVDSIFYNQDSLALLDGYKPLYLTEGESDTMTLATLGHVAIGFPGATQFQLLGRLTQWAAALEGKIPQIICAFDEDPAGHYLEQKVRELDLDVPISSYELGDYNDVNDQYLDTL